MTIDEAVELYPGEWMLMQVLERDDYHSPSRGVIVAHRQTRGGIQKTLIRILIEAKGSARQYYFFCGFRDLRSPEEWQEALERAWLEDAKEALIVG